VTDYKAKAVGDGLHMLSRFKLLSESAFNATPYYGDSGSGIVLRRHYEATNSESIGTPAAGRSGDTLYGMTTSVTLISYSMNVSAGEPELVRHVHYATSVPYMLGSKEALWN